MRLFFTECNKSFVDVLITFWILGVKSVISVIDGRLQSTEDQDKDEYESAIEALGQIGSCKYANYCCTLQDLTSIYCLFSEPIHFDDNIVYYFHVLDVIVFLILKYCFALILVQEE